MDVCTFRVQWGNDAFVSRCVVSRYEDCLTETGVMVMNAPDLPLGEVHSLPGTVGIGGLDLHLEYDPRMAPNGRPRGPQILKM